MADKVKLWFDPKGDYLELTFSDAPGYMREAKSDAVMQRVDEQGHVIGFSVIGVSKFQKDHRLRRSSSPKCSNSSVAKQQHPLLLAAVKGLKYKNVAAELLAKLLGDEIKVRSKRNLGKAASSGVIARRDHQHARRVRSPITTRAGEVWSRPNICHLS